MTPGIGADVQFHKLGLIKQEAPWPCEPFTSLAGHILPISFPLFLLAFNTWQEHLELSLSELKKQFSVIFFSCFCPDLEEGSQSMELASGKSWQFGCCSRKSCYHRHHHHYYRIVCTEVYVEVRVCRRKTLGVIFKDIISLP